MNERRRARLRAIRKERSICLTMTSILLMLSIALAASEMPDVETQIASAGFALIGMICSVLLMKRAKRLTDDETFVMQRRYRSLKDGTFMHNR